jgi:hypothetical protein
MTMTSNRIFKIGDLVRIEAGFVPQGCFGPPSHVGVIVSDDHDVYVPAWSTTKRFSPAELSPRTGEPTKDECEAIAEARSGLTLYIILHDSMGRWAIRTAENRNVAVGGPTGPLYVRRQECQEWFATDDEAVGRAKELAGQYEKIEG